MIISSFVPEVEEMTPALDLLCSAIRESDSETQSKHFAEQLLHLTLSFLNKQIKELFVHSAGEDSTEGGPCLSWSEQNQGSRSAPGAHRSEPGAHRSEPGAHRSEEDRVKERV